MSGRRIGYGTDGASIVHAIEAEARRRGVPATEFAMPLASKSARSAYTCLAQLRKVVRPHAATVDRVNSLLASGIPPSSSVVAEPVASHDPFPCFYCGARSGCSCARCSPGASIAPPPAIPTPSARSSRPAGRQQDSDHAE